MMEKVEEIIDNTKEFNMSTIITAHIHGSNTASQRLFQSFGYAVTGVQKERYIKNADALIVEKVLPVKKSVARL